MDLTKELAALRQMTPAQLRAKHVDVFGEPSRSGNKDFLLKRIAWRIQSDVEGTLSERARQRAAELARDSDIRITMPKSRPTTPGARTTVKPAPIFRPDGAPMPGAVLVKKYRGQTIEVRVLSTGYEWNGEVYKSLSAVAKAITGTHWNGRVFFGLKGEAK